MRVPSSSGAMGRLLFLALLALGCSRTVLVTGSSGRDAGTPDGPVVLPDGALPRPDATVGPDAGRDGGGSPDGGDPALGLPAGGPPDLPVPDIGPPDIGPPPALCRVVAPASCGRPLSDPPCFVAQLAETEGTACAYQAIEAARQCVAGVSTILAGLDILARERSFFVPNDEAMVAALAAFGARPGQQREPVRSACSDVEDDDVAALDALFTALGYLVVEGRLTAARLARSPDASVRSVVGQLEGGEGIKVYLVPGAPTLRYVGPDRRIQQANIVRQNVRVTAGAGDARSIVHVIDAFVPAPNLLDVVLLEGLDLLADALEDASPALVDGMLVPLNDGLEDPERILTVFGPTDAAFRRLGTITNPDALRDRLLYHSSQGERGFLQADLPASLLMLDGNVLSVFRAEVPVRVAGGSGGAEVVRGDVQATNGVLHVIDGVLAP